MLGTAVKSVRLAIDNVEAEFGGDDHLAAYRLQRGANQLFIREWSVHFRRVEEGNTVLERTFLLCRRCPFIIDELMKAVEDAGRL